MALNPVTTLLYGTEKNTGNLIEINKTSGNRLLTDALGNALQNGTGIAFDVIGQL